MDIPRPSNAREKKMRRIAYGTMSVLVLGGATLGISRLRPAPPDRRPGEHLHRHREARRDDPRSARHRHARAGGYSLDRRAKFGSRGQDRFAIGREGEARFRDAGIERSAAPARRARRGVCLQGRRSRSRQSESAACQRSDDAKVAAADIESEYQQAKLQAEADRQLADAGSRSRKSSPRNPTVAAEQLAIREKLAQEQFTVADDAAKAQVAAQQAHLEQQRVLYELKKNQLDALHVRAGLSGVLSAVSVEIGQQVTPGTNLVRVADPTHLKATVQIPETQAKDVLIGQRASVDTHNGVAQGHVIRIDAAVVNGTVAVDVSLDGPQPPGERPDLSVDGTIQIDDLKNVLYVGRPVNGQENSTIGLFKLVDGDGEAARTSVKLGRRFREHDRGRTRTERRRQSRFSRICRHGTALTGFGCAREKCNGGEWTADQARRRHEGISCG